jgi:hypothetical protein
VGEEGRGVGDMAVTQSQKKVVTEARGGAGSVRRINEGGGEVRVSGYQGGVAPVTSPKYRECSGGAVDRWRVAVWPGGEGVTSATSGRPVTGGVREGGTRGCCRRRKPKESRTEEGDWQS